ncbi:hypothetical protein D3C81_1439160 [compost metagenome]
MQQPVFERLLNIFTAWNHIFQQTVQEADMPDGDLKRLYARGLQRSYRQGNHLGVRIRGIISDQFHSGLKKLRLPSRLFLNRPEHVGVI